MSPGPKAFPSRQDVAIALVALPAVVGVAAWVWLRFVPNGHGGLGQDYSLWLPLMLAGDFFHARNGWLDVAWFSPAQCGGVPFHANPEGDYLSLPQWLSFVLPPVRSLQASFLLYDSAGFLGAFVLARRGFGLGPAASVLAGALFAWNSFFGARFAIGHLSFAPFMLLPAAALCLLGGTGILLRSATFGLLLAVSIESGMLMGLPPLYLSLLAVVALHVFACDGTWRLPVLRMAAGTLWGLLLSAGKLAAVLALVSNFPRDIYKLPGFLSLAEAAWVTLRALFIGPFPDMTARLANASVLFEQHEFEYSIGPVPLLLILGAWIAARRRGVRMDGRQRIALDALVVLLLVPVALNTYAAGWNGFLKMLPVIRNSSSLLRYVAGDMLPLILAGALAADYLAGAQDRRRGAIAAASLAIAAAALVLPARAYYGPDAQGTYDPSAMQAGWHSLVAHGDVQAIERIGDIAPASGPSQAQAAMQRQDMMMHGASTLNCYYALFGYRLENYPRGSLHPGSVFDPTGDALNIKNPACYVFPAANSCKPGDAFSAGAIDQARRFVAYQSFAWRKPFWAMLADWVGCVFWPITAGLLIWGLLRQRTATLAS